MQKNGKTDPFTRQPIKGPLYPCVTIKKAIHEFLDRNPWAYEYTEGENYKDIDFWERLLQLSIDQSHIIICGIYLFIC